MIYKNQIVKSVVLSAAATILGIVFAFTYSAKVPQQVGGFVDHDSINHQVGQVISQDEWNWRQEEAEKMYQEAQQKVSERQNTSEVFRDIKSHGFVVAWLPWLLVPFLVALNFRVLISLFVLPLFFIPTGLVVWFEIVLYLLTIGAAHLIKSSIFTSNVPA